MCGGWRQRSISAYDLRVTWELGIARHLVAVCLHVRADFGIVVGQVLITVFKGEAGLQADGVEVGPHDLLRHPEPGGGIGSYLMRHFERLFAEPGVRKYARHDAKSFGC